MPLKQLTAQLKPVDLDNFTFEKISLSVLSYMSEDLIKLPLETGKELFPRVLPRRYIKLH